MLPQASVRGNPADVTQRSRCASRNASSADRILVRRPAREPESRAHCRAALSKISILKDNQQRLRESRLNRGPSDLISRAGTEDTSA